jgi:hypothetical protein
MDLIDMDLEELDPNDMHLNSGAAGWLSLKVNSPAQAVGPIACCPGVA